MLHDAFKEHIQLTLAGHVAYPIATKERPNMRIHQQSGPTQVALAQGSSSEIARTHQNARLRIHGIGLVFQGDAAKLKNGTDWGLPELVNVEAFYRVC